jgi:hypothetical protein
MYGAHEASFPKNEVAEDRLAKNATRDTFTSSEANAGNGRNERQSPPTWAQTSKGVRPKRRASTSQTFS